MGKVKTIKDYNRKIHERTQKVKTIVPKFKQETNINKYKAMIDYDLNKYGKDKRIYTLLKSWIMNISHKIMPSSKYFVHVDRKILRKELLKYLKEKWKSKQK